LTAAVCFAAALSWAQIPTSRADITKVAAQRLDVAAKKLKLSPDQVNKIKPLTKDQVQNILTPGQLKQWDSVAKDWEDEATLQGLGEHSEQVAALSGTPLLD